ncbi:MAG: hypothetical protein ABIF11_02120 [Nitrospirota bacterium]
MGISGVDTVNGVSGAYFNLRKNLLPVSTVNFPHQNKNPLEIENNPHSQPIGSFHSIFNSLRNNQRIDKNNEINFQNEKELSKEECGLCQGRKYICSNGETSDGISTIISGRQSALRVQHHETQHLHQAKINATQKGKIVVSQHIYLQYATCPECEGTYVSAGQAVTSTMSKQEFRQQIQSSKPTYQPSGALNNQKPEGKGVNIDFYG